jgi:hypothetical protein
MVAVVSSGVEMCHPYSGSGCFNKHLNSLLFTYKGVESGMSVNLTL